MSSPDGAKWLVAVVDEMFSDTTNESSVVRLNDPSTKELRQYLFVNEQNIVEIQSLSADFSSFIVGRHVVKDGNLYMLNKVDPLFWLLCIYSPTEQCKQWQPFDQIVESLAEEVRKSLVEKQISHLCQVMSADQTGDVPYYKFNADKALKWLQQKQERVFQCIVGQSLEKQRLSKETIQKSGSGGGAISATFNMPDDPMAAAPTDSDAIIVDSKKLKIESAQIVSSYISEEWSKKLVESLGIKEEAVMEITKTTKSRPNNKPNTVENAPSEKKEVKKVEGSRTVGNKRLAKISTKGMKSLGSFFGAPKKKSKTQ
eukprot:scaffold481_cov208-Cylindrotheca_fusiformis.AAC.6